MEIRTATTTASDTAEGKTIRVVTYARVSTHKQEDEGQSLANQERAFQKAIRRNGWTRVREYVEGKSGRAKENKLTGLLETNRRVFDGMIRDVTTMTPRPDLIVCDTIDRFGRDAEVSMQMYRQLRATGVKLYFLDHGDTMDFDDPIDGLRNLQNYYRGIMDAEIESRRIGVRIRKHYDGVREDMKSNPKLMVGNRAPVGLLRGADGCVAIDDEPNGPGLLSPADVIRQADRKFVDEHQDALTVGRWVMMMLHGGRRGWTQEQGYRTKCLVNPLYVVAGLRSPEDQAAIDARLAVNRERASRNRKSTQGRPMTGVASCPICVSNGVESNEATLFGSNNGSLACRRNRAVRGSSVAGTWHESLQIQEYIVEALFREMVDVFLAEPQWLARFEDSRANSNVALNERHLKEQLEAVEEDIKALDKRRSAAFGMASDPDFADMAREELQAVKDERKVIDERRSVLTGELARCKIAPAAVYTADELAKRLREVRALWDSPDILPSQKNELARTLCHLVGSHPVVIRAARGVIGLQWNELAGGLVIEPRPWIVRNAKGFYVSPESATAARAITSAPLAVKRPAHEGIADHLSVASARRTNDKVVGRAYRNPLLDLLARVTPSAVYSFAS